jgi:hypothetical protein
MSRGRCSTIVWPTPRQLNRPTQAADLIRQLGIMSLESRKPQAEVFGICLRGHAPLELVLELLFKLLYVAPHTLLALREHVCRAFSAVAVVGWAGRHSRMTTVLCRCSSCLMLTWDWIRSVVEIVRQSHLWLLTLWRRKRCPGHRLPFRHAPDIWLLLILTGGTRGMLANYGTLVMHSRAERLRTLGYAF